MTSLKNLLYFYQKPEAINDKYPKEFELWVKSTEDFDACILGKFPYLVKNKWTKMFSKKMDMASEAEITKCKEAVKKEVVAAQLVHGAG